MPSGKNGHKVNETEQRESAESPAEQASDVEEMTGLQKLQANIAEGKTEVAKAKAAVAKAPKPEGTKTAAPTRTLASIQEEYVNKPTLWTFLANSRASNNLVGAGMQPEEAVDWLIENVIRPHTLGHVKYHLATKAGFSEKSAQEYLAGEGKQVRKRTVGGAATGAAPVAQATKVTEKSSEQLEVATRAAEKEARGEELTDHERIALAQWQAENAESPAGEPEATTIE